MRTSESLGVTKYKIQKKGHRSEANLLMETTESDERAKHVKKQLLYPESPISYTKHEALTFTMENNLTKQQYINIRKAVN